jgi:peptidoglycan hydrolase-like protein with peptidoglycan-binding domain
MRDPRVARPREDEKLILLLKQGLKNAGLYHGPVNGFFDGPTEQALREFRRENHMIPGGNVNKWDLEALGTFSGPLIGRLSLGVGPTDSLVMHPLFGVPFDPVTYHPSLELSYPPVTMHISDAGKDFIFYHEARDGSTTGHLHWPKGKSGVTLGPGYDMWQRTKEQVQNDLKDLIDVKGKPIDAAKVSQAAGMNGAAADAFVKQNRDLVSLDVANQKKLMNAYLPPQEQWVRDAFHVHLVQYEFDALTSFAGNAALKFGTVANHINYGEVRKALDVILSAVGDSPDTIDGLRSRRKCEVAFYLNGRCGCRY